MAPVACNDAELAAMLAPPVMEGLKIVGETNLEPDAYNVISSRVGRGSWYVPNIGGSLSRAWTTKTFVGAGFNLGTMEFYFDNDKVSHVVSDYQGQHVTPRWISDGHGGIYENHDFEMANNIAEIIDLGLGGMKLGPENPTRSATNFWDIMLMNFRSNQRQWITAGLRAAGLTVM